MQWCASIILALLQKGEAGDRSVTGQLMYTAQQWNQERPCFNKEERKKVTGYHACKAKLESFGSLWLKELSTMTLRGTVFITLRPTVMSLSGVGEGHLVTFVLAMPSTAVLVMYLGMLRLVESPECDMKTDMTVWGSGTERHNGVNSWKPSSYLHIRVVYVCTYVYKCAPWLLHVNTRTYAYSNQLTEPW